MVHERHFEAHNSIKKLKGIFIGSLMFSAFALTTALLFPGSLFPSKFKSNIPKGSYATHAPINIVSDANFTLPQSVSGVTSGSGTSSSPYIINNWQINDSVSTTGAGIYIRNTRKYVNITMNNIIGNSTNSGYGIRLSNASNVYINGIKISSITYGMRITSSCIHIIVNNVTISSVSTGAWLTVNNTQFTNLNVASSAGVGICINSTSSSNGINDTVKNSIVHDCTGDAILIIGSKNKITNTNLTNNLGNGIHVIGTNNIVTSNVITGNTKLPIFLDASGASSNIVSFNTLYSSLQTPTMLISNAPDNVIMNNTIINMNAGNPNPMGIIVSGSTSLRNNLTSNSFSVNQTAVVVNASASNTIIQGNMFNQCNTAVLVQGASTTYITGNTVNWNASISFNIISTNGVNIKQNTINNLKATTPVLIQNYRSNSTVIQSNILKGGNTAIHIMQSNSLQLNYNTITNFSSSGIHTGNQSISLTITNNTIYNSISGTGVWLEGSGNTVSGNNLTRLSIGISISNIVIYKKNNIIKHNTIESNTGYGLILDGNTSMSLVLDNIFNNTWSGYNVLCQNSTNYFYQITMGTRNILNGPNIGGNYWDNYTGIDSNLDGFGQTPYSQANVIDQDPIIVLPVLNTPPNQDYYQNLNNYVIPWIIRVALPITTAKTYQVYINNTTYGSPGSWTSGTALNIPVDTTRAAGYVYNYTLKYSYVAAGGSQWGRQGSVFVYIRAVDYQVLSVTTTNQTTRIASFGLTVSAQGSMSMNLYIARYNDTSHLTHWIPGTPGQAKGIDVRVVQNMATTFSLNYSMTIEYTDAQLAGLGINDVKIDPYLWNNTSQQWMNLRTIAKSYSVNTMTNKIYLTMAVNTALTGEFIFIGTPQLVVTTNGTYYTNAQSVMITTTWSNIINASLLLTIKNSGGTTVYSNPAWGITNSAGVYSNSIKISTVVGLNNDNFSIFISASNGTFTKNNSASLTYFIVDSIAPIITILSPSNNGCFNTVFSISTRMIDVNLNSSSMYYRIDSTSNGTYSFSGGNATINTIAFNSIGNKNHTVYVYGNDLSGNTGTAKFYFTKDTKAPVITSMSPNNNTCFNAPINILVYVNETNFASVTYQIDSLAIRSFTRNITTSINSSDWASLAEGSHTITITAHDLAGNSKLGYIIFIKDTINPVVQITSPATNIVVKQPFMINTKVYDANLYSAGYYYRIDSTSNTSYSLSGGNATIDATAFNSIGNMNHTLYVYAQDKAGNIGFAKVYFTKDTIAPSLSIAYPSNNTCFNSAFNFRVNVYDVNFKNITYKVDSLTTHLFSRNTSTTVDSTDWASLAEGSHVITITTWDSASNSKVGTINFVKDTIAPVLTIVSPSNGTCFNAAFNIQITVKDVNYNSTTYQIYNLAVRTIPANASTLINTNDWSSLADGPYQIKITTYDFAGNTKLGYINFVKDTIVPSIVLNAPTVSNAPTDGSSIYFNNTFHMSVTITDTNLKTCWLTVDDVLGTKTIFSNSTPYLPSSIFNSLTQGSHVVKIYANDSASNQNFISFTFIKDTILPSVTRVLPASDGGYYNAPFNYQITVIEKNLDDSWIRIDSLTAVSTSYAENSTNTFTQFSTLSEGHHELYFVSRDWAGNIQYVTLNFTKDTINPTVQITAPASNVIVKQPFMINTKVTDVNLYSSGYYYRIDSTSNASYSLSGGNATIDSTAFSSIGNMNHTLYVYAQDKAGNIGFAKIYFIKDTVNPVIQITSPANNAYVRVAFTINTKLVDANPNASSMYYRIDSQSNGTYTFSGNASISTAAFNAISNGNHTLYMYGLDLASNLGSSKLYFTKDTIAPTLSIQSPVNGTAYNSRFSFTVNIIEVNFYNLTYQVDTRPTRAFSNATSTTINNGDWTYIGEGSHQIKFVASDLAGNTRTGYLNFIKDTISPTLSIPYPSNSSTSYFKSPFNFRADVYDLHFDHVTYEVDLLATNSFSANLSTTLPLAYWQQPDLRDGSHQLTITAYDAAGNSISRSINFVKDTTLPALTLVSPANNSYFNSSITISATITDANLQKEWYYIDSPTTNITFTGGSFTPFTSPTFLSLSQGLHVIKIYANDSAGNVNSFIFRFTKDTILPSITITSPAQSTIFNAQFTINTRVIEVNFNYMFYRIDSTTNGTTAFNGNQSITLAQFTALSQGSHVVNIYATDLAGNLNFASLTFIKDTLAPSIMVLNPVTNNTINKVAFALNLRVIDPHFSTTWYRIDAGTNVVFSGNATITGFTTFSQGSHTLYASANDSVGNTATRIITFIKDTVAPVITFNQNTNQTPYLGVGFVGLGNNVTIKLKAQDAYAGIQSVFLYVNITGAYVSFNMTNQLINQTAGIYQYTISGQSYEGIWVSYYFTMADKVGNSGTSATYTYFIVYDTTHPVVAVNNAVQYSATKASGTTQTFSCTLKNWNATNSQTVIYTVQATRPDGVVMTLIYNTYVVSAGGTTSASLSLSLPVGITGVYSCTIELKTGWIASGGYTMWVKTLTFTAT